MGAGCGGSDDGVWVLGGGRNAGERERCRFAVFDTVSVERKVIRLAFKIWG